MFQFFSWKYVSNKEEGKLTSNELLKTVRVKLVRPSSSKCLRVVFLSIS